MAQEAKMRKVIQVESMLSYNTYVVVDRHVVVDRRQQ